MLSISIRYPRRHVVQRDLGLGFGFGSVNHGLRRGDGELQLFWFV